MTARPGRRDFTVSPGAVNRWRLGFRRAGDYVAASTVAAGDYIVHDGRVWRVDAAGVTVTGRVRLVLGLGTIGSPTVTLDPADLVQTAPMAVWEDVSMRVLLPENALEVPAWTHPDVMDVPAVLEAGDTVAVVTIDDAWLEPFQLLIDYGGLGSPVLKMRHDVHGTFDGEARHVLTGSLVVDRSAVAPPLEAPVVVEV
jgi:hypothetical protein